MFGKNDNHAPWGRSRITVEDGDEVRYWTEALGVDEAELRGAIQAVGDSPDDVHDYLTMRHQSQHTA